MFDHVIIPMVNALVHSGVVPVEKEDDAVAVLQQYWADKIAHVWCIDDVKGERPDLTEEQCKQVLEQVDQDLDSTVGITWDVIQDTAYSLFGPGPDTDPEAEDEDEDE